MHNPLILRVESGDFSYCGWINLSVDGYRGGIYSNRNSLDGYLGDSNISQLLSTQTGNLQWIVAYVEGITNQLVSTKNILDNSWHFITLSKTTTTLKMYIDGNLEDQKSGLFGDASNPLGEYWIGRGRDGANWDRTNLGKIDDIRIYNRTLTEEEILALFHE